MYGDSFCMAFFTCWRESMASAKADVCHHVSAGHNRYFTNFAVLWFVVITYVFYVINFFTTFFYWWALVQYNISVGISWCGKNCWYNCGYLVARRCIAGELLYERFAGFLLLNVLICTNNLEAPSCGKRSRDRIFFQWHLEKPRILTKHTHPVPIRIYLMHAHFICGRSRPYTETTDNTQKWQSSSSRVSTGKWFCWSVTAPSGELCNHLP